MKQGYRIINRGIPLKEATSIYTYNWKVSNQVDNERGNPKTHAVGDIGLVAIFRITLKNQL